jgi:hypothetical protein
MPRLSWINSSFEKKQTNKNQDRALRDPAISAKKDLTMAFRNDPELLEYAKQGYEDKPFEGYETSTVWHAWKAGKALGDSGRSAPVKCAASRGTSIRIETEGGLEIKVHFDKKTLEVSEIERCDA